MITELESKILKCLLDNAKGLKGLEIARLINRNIGLLYPVLDSLIKEDLIAAHYDEFRDPKRGGARAKHYKITESGISELSDYCNLQHSENFDGLTTLL